jgi:hypothetical protein
VSPRKAGGGRKGGHTRSGSGRRTRTGRRTGSGRRGSSARPGARKGGGGGGMGRVLLFAAGLVGVALLAARFFDGAASDAGVAVDPAPWTQGRVRIEVLNGGGVNGMARAATEVLRDSGFDVVSFGNAAAFDPSRPSAVVDRVGRTDMALAVAKALGIDSVQTDPDPNLYVDVSVVLGQEWMAPVATTADEAPEPRAPWDPRSWLDR